jgi:aspartate dehydrogenase
MVTRKPPAGLKGAPYLEQNKIDVDIITTPTKIFDGSARDGARGFPANVNVAAALSLAGIGPDKTRLEIWADPTVTRNIHTIELDADSVRVTMTTENVPPLGETTEKGLYVDPSATFSQAYHPRSRGPF